MALEPDQIHTFEATYETGSGHKRITVKSKFTIDRKYEMIKVLGHGAYGVVIAALNKETGQKVAIKRMDRMCYDRIDGVHALREIRLMRWLGKHPNIITLKDMMVNLADDELYIVMDLMDSDLHKIIQSSQPLEDAHFKHFMYQLLRGLRFAHSYGVIHRDLKPANLLVTKACDLVISDFGLARQLPETGPMTEHVVTRWYRAPELMLSADGHYDLSVDIWAAGCIFAELLGRTPLFPGADFKDTLRLQHEYLGTRPDDELAYIRSEEALKFLGTLPHKPQKSWAEVFPEANPKAIDLIGKMLQFHFAKRISVDDALAHPYFDSVRSQYPDSDPELPLGPGGFDFSFESDDTLDENAFRRLIVEEVLSFRADVEYTKKLKSIAASGGTATTAAVAAAGAVTGAGAMPVAGSAAAGTAAAGSAAAPAAAAGGRTIATSGAGVADVAAGPATIVGPGKR